MKVALVKIAPSGDRLIPLSLACLQAYLKENGIKVDVYDVRGNYDLEKILENPFSQMYSARLVPTHHEIPLILPMVDAILKGKDIDLSEGIYPDLIMDRAIRIYDIPSQVATRYKAKLRTTKTFAKKISGKYDLIGFTTNYLNAAEIAFTSAFLKQSDPSIIILWGGPNVIQSPDLMRFFISKGICDGIALGEGEDSFLEVAMGKPISEVAGIMTFQNGNPTFHKRDPIHLDLLPTPDWSGISLDPYYRTLSLYSSRGCPNRCKFCAEWALFGPKFRQRSATKVVEDLVKISKNFNPEYLIFGDSALNADPEFFTQLCDLLIAQGNDIPMAAHFRANISPEEARKARKAGFDDAWIGVEALTDKTLCEMHKGIEARQNIDVIRAFTSAGIHVIAMLVVGSSTPAQEIANYQALLNNIKQLSQERVVDLSGNKIPLSLAFRPAPWFLLPGSLDFQQFAKEITRPWKPLSISAGNEVDLESLTTTIAHLPYEFIRKTPDEIIFSIIHGIQEANRAAKFAVGGTNNQILKYLNRLSPNNIEDTLRSMGVPGLEILDTYKKKSE